MEQANTEIKLLKHLLGKKVPMELEDDSNTGEGVFEETDEENEFGEREPDNGPDRELHHDTNNIYSNQPRHQHRWDPEKLDCVRQWMSYLFRDPNEPSKSFFKVQRECQFTHSVVDRSEVITDELVHCSPFTDVVLMGVDKTLVEELYPVPFNCLDTDQGKTIIRTHAATSDAQKAYADMREYCLRSARAELNAADHLAYITNAKLGNGQWRGTAESFILNWQDRLRKHTDTLKDKSAALHDTTKLALLQNAVSLIPQLNDVKLRANQYNSATKQVTTYAEYVAFLVTASQQYDRTNS
ncbi:hypothetical protein IV203_032537 [Nitzschia inconspicua]|uniref:Uncharacterized protein n=1 Tax=Nitzschia inconspicua TaxID=303405 RepID=A0A9K3KKH2_9STRA|nr:hypothetical protein IV203_032537 [Nitzschia inconspicua]